MKRLKIHEFALMLPRVTGRDYALMRDDISKNGVRVPIILFQGKILDGINRYLIAIDLGVPFKTENFNGTAENALELVMSYNVHRRHMNQSQKAMVAAAIVEKLKELDGMDANEATDKAIEVTGASHGYAKKAERIIRDEPKAAQKILNGKETIGGHYGREIRHTCPNCGHQW